MSLPAKYVAATILIACSIMSFAQSTPPPSWVYSSYFGGTGQDFISAQTRDQAGNVYVTGSTTSPDFPTTPGVYEPTYPGPTGYWAIFVSKFSAAGALVWSTFLGPGTWQYNGATGLQVDANQNVYIGGIFQDPGFPTTPGLPNSGSVFVTKLNSTGSQLVYGALLGGRSILAAPQLVLDSSANAFIAGTGDYCCNGSTGVIGPLGGVEDFWIAEIDSAGSALTWSVEIGGSGDDEADGLAIDRANKLYVTGYSDSYDFPTTPGALVQYGLGRTLVVKLDPTKPSASSMVYSALVGNPGHSSNDFISAESIAVDRSGNAYVGAWTYNLRLFTSPRAFQKIAPPTPNAYVFELNRSGSAITNGTYLGGGDLDFVTAVSVDKIGNVYVSGVTDSWDFLTTAYGNPLQPEIPYHRDQAYYVKLNPQFAAISSVVIGGPDNVDAGPSVPDGSGGLWVAGNAGAQFPVTANAYQPTYGGNYDGFLFHTDFERLCAGEGDGVALCTIAADPTSPERIHFTAQAANVEAADSITLAIDKMPAYFLHAAQFDTWLPVAPGDHTATVLVRDIKGSWREDRREFTVAASSACPMNPLNPSLTFCSPLNAAVVSGPLTILVVSSESVPPPSLSLHVDGAFVASVAFQNGSYTYTLELPPGVHRVSVKGTDSSQQQLRTSAVFRETQ
jgi:hypothetical protein